MYEISVRILNGDFDVSVQHKPGSVSENAVKLDKGITGTVEVDSMSHAASYLRPVIRRYTATVNDDSVPEVAAQIMRAYQEELQDLLGKAGSLDKAILKAAGRRLAARY